MLRIYRFFKLKKLIHKNTNQHIGYLTIKTMRCHLLPLVTETMTNER
ncbi:hypothetical protein PROVRETT_09929 [Providencia rettgeri DSM 1131]|nr:hypothetical protein PROVRETT_09929 [Providencia rettgeri DSM 1131]